MTKRFVLLALTLFTISVKAQNLKPDTSYVLPYGKVDSSELAMKTCSFEKDANAVVLFDKASLTVDQWWSVTLIRHKRIKILNSNGKDEANISLPFFDKMTDIQAETINSNDGKIEYIPVDPKLIYKQKDGDIKSLTFTFPDVRAGSIIELKYTWKITSEYYMPSWYFQSNIPTCYSEITAKIYTESNLKMNISVKQPFIKDSLYNVEHKSSLVRILALNNVHSYVKEPYMTPEYQNIQRLSFTSFKRVWTRVGDELSYDKNFGLQLTSKLSGEKAILARLDSIKDKNVKIDSIFTLVKNNMKWNNKDELFTDDGIQSAWNKKTGSSTEINLILCRLLTRAGFDACPMVVSTPDYGVVDPAIASLSQFDRAVVYIPIDSVSYYILDASDKRNIYKLMPFDLLSTYGLSISTIDHKYRLLNLFNTSNQAQQTVFIKAKVSADGKMSGTTDLVCYNYNRYGALKLYQKLGEKKYKDLLKEDDNNLTIDSLKLVNVENSELPLYQHFNFNLNLPASDENYIYFNFNIFALGANPFLSENRYSDIDFTYNDTYRITAIYNLPEGYKVESIPKNQILVMEDKSMTIKRVVAEDKGVINVRYVITRNKSFYTKDQYKGLYVFYKRMYELMNEQIVLKKT